MTIRFDTKRFSAALDSVRSSGTFQNVRLPAPPASHRPRPAVFKPEAIPTSTHSPG